MLFSSCKCHPSHPQVNHSAQRNNEILPSFWGGNWLSTSQVRPLQFTTYCKMLAKCFIKLFCCRQCRTVIFVLTPCSVILFICASMSDIPGDRKSDFTGTFSRTKIFGKTDFLAGSIRFDIQSKLNMYLTLLQPHKMRTINCNKYYVQYVDHLACIVDWPTIGITDPAEIAGNAGLGQQQSMHFEICLLCATAPVCMFWFFVHLNDFHFVWFEVFFAL